MTNNELKQIIDAGQEKMLVQLCSRIRKRMWGEMIDSMSNQMIRQMFGHTQRHMEIMVGKPQFEIIYMDNII